MGLGHDFDIHGADPLAEPPAPPDIGINARLGWNSGLTDARSNPFAFAVPGCAADLEPATTRRPRAIECGHRTVGDALFKHVRTAVRHHGVKPGRPRRCAGANTDRHRGT